MNILESLTNSFNNIKKRYFQKKSDEKDQNDIVFQDNSDEKDHNYIVFQNNSDEKDQNDIAFQNSSFEKDINDIIFSQNIMIYSNKLEQIKKYLSQIEYIDIIIMIMKEKLTLNIYYKYLLNLFNMLEYLILNGQILFVDLCRIHISKNINEINNLYVYLENGIDKSYLVKNKIKKIILLFNDYGYLLEQRLKSN